MSLRYNVRQIRLGTKKQMSLKEEKLYIPTLGNDGVWQLTSRGDSGTLGKKFALTHDEDLSETVIMSFRK